MMPSVLRRRGAWHGFRPQRLRAGLWLHVRWLWWTWDYFPQPIAVSLGKIVDDLRSKNGGTHA